MLVLLFDSLWFLVCFCYLTFALGDFNFECMLKFINEFRNEPAYFITIIRILIS